MRNNGYVIKWETFATIECDKFYGSLVHSVVCVKEI